MQQNKVGEQNLLKQLGHSSLVVILSALFSILSASSFSEFKKKQSTAFTNYKEENDRIFTSYFKLDWEAYLLKKPISRYKEQKPREIQTAIKKVPKVQGPKISINVVKDNNNTIVKVPLIPIENKDVNFDFYGSSISFNIPLGMDKARFYPQTKKGIASYFNTVALSPYDELIDNIKKTSNILNLNDWGKYMLIKKLSESIFHNQDESRLLSWFIFNKLGYSVRVGLANSHIVVMHHSKKTIYATPNYKIGSKKFYVLSDYGKGSAGKIFTYKQNYPGADKALDLSMESLPKFIENTMQKTLTFQEYGKKYSIKYNYNQNLIDFMSTYPQVDYDIYFNTPLDQSSYRDIAMELKKYINTKQASVALNFVLHFVQNAFHYELDSQQFGREKVMFAQETLYYDKSDCEDRAVLYSYLVKELFKIGVVGVKYKDHMATALYIPINGDSVKVHSKKFIIADPTYVNASIGQSMPKYKSKRPEEFILMNSSKG